MKGNRPLICISADIKPMESDLRRYDSELHDTYSNAVYCAGGLPIPTCAVGAEELAELCDGLLLSGGADLDPCYYGEEILNNTVKIRPERDAFELALFRAFFDAGKPIFGICRGCQLINVTLGGTLTQEIGKGHYHDKNRNTKTKKGTSMRLLYGTSVHTLHYHHQAIKKLAKSLKVTMVDAKDGTIEGVQHKTLPVYGIQYHPDRMYLKASPSIRKNGKKVMEYFFDICYSKRPVKKPAPAKPAAPSVQPESEQPAQQPADAQTGTDTDMQPGADQTDQTGQPSADTQTGAEADTPSGADQKDQSGQTEQNGQNDQNSTDQNGQDGTDQNGQNGTDQNNQPEPSGQ